MLDDADRIWNRACEPARDRLEQAEDDYFSAVPDDGVLETAFRKRLRESPSDFAAVT